VPGTGHLDRFEASGRQEWSLGVAGEAQEDDEVHQLDANTAGRVRPDAEVAVRCTVRRETALVCGLHAMGRSGLLLAPAVRVFHPD